MKLSEIRKIIEFSQKNGLKRIKIDTFECEFFDPPTSQKELVGVHDASEKSEYVAPIDQKNIPIEDEADLLFWSSDAYDEHIASKQDNEPKGLAQ